MHIVKNIKVDGSTYLSSHVVGYTSQEISKSLDLLNASVMEYVKREYGQRKSTECVIIDIHNFDQVAEPILDGILLYRIIEDPRKIHVYQKVTQVVDQNGWFVSSRVPISRFYRTDIFELEKYEGLTDAVSTALVMVPHGPSGVCIPKQLTVAPASELINELRQSLRFQELRQQLDCYTN